MFDEFEKYFNDLMKQFNENIPSFYAYRVTFDDDGKPHYQDLTKPVEQKTYDEIVTDKELKFVFEMAGLEKEDIQIDVEGDLLKVHGEHGERKYHEQIPLKYKVITDNPKATYKNGILEVIFKRDEKVKTTKVDVE